MHLLEQELLETGTEHTFVWRGFEMIGQLVQKRAAVHFPRFDAMTWSVAEGFERDEDEWFNQGGWGNINSFWPCFKISKFHPKEWPNFSCQLISWLGAFLPPALGVEAQQLAATAVDHLGRLADFVGFDHHSFGLLRAASVTLQLSLAFVNDDCSIHLFGVLKKTLSSWWNSQVPGVSDHLCPVLLCLLVPCQFTRWRKFPPWSWCVSSQMGWRLGWRLNEASFF